MTRRIHPIVVGGALAGVLDILAAFALSGAYGNPPQAVLKGIASGLLGPAAFRGGAGIAALGLALHFVIAFGAAAVYYVASRWWPFLVHRPAVAGAIYGVAVYVAMNAVVLPLSRVASRPRPWSIIAWLVAIHIVCVGLPIALVVARRDSPIPRFPD